MKTINEIKQWLLENATDEKGDLVLSNLDLSDFNGDVYIDGWKVKRSLMQFNQTVGEDLLQYHQIVKGDLIQSFQKVNGNLFQFCQKVKGTIIK